MELSETVVKAVEDTLVSLVELHPTAFNENGRIKPRAVRFGLQMLFSETDLKMDDLLEILAFEHKVIVPREVLLNWPVDKQ